MTFGALFTQVTGFFDRRFQTTYFLPSLLFWGLLIVIWFAGQGNIAAVEGLWKGEGAVWVIRLVVFFAWLVIFANVLASLSSDLLRLYEGYWNFPLSGPVRRLGIAWHQRKARQYNVPAHYEKIYLGYPKPTQLDEILPTRLGNILKNSELYPMDHYGADGVLMWPRLYDLFPTPFTEAIVELRTAVDSMLVISFLSAVFALISGTYLVVVQGSPYLFLLCFGGGLLISWMAYRGAVSNALLYGQQIKTGFDLYRLELLKQMRVPLPKNLGEELKTWEQLKEFIYNNNVLPWTYAGAAQPDQSQPKKEMPEDHDSQDQPTTPESPATSSSQPAPSSPVFSHIHYAVLILSILLVAGFVYLRRQHTPRPSGNQPTELIVVQLNDIYRLDAVRNGKRGGLARVTTLIRQIKTEHPNVPIVVLHAGDFLAPSLESEIFHGAHMVDALNFLNTLAPIYAVPGNHEFDYDADETQHLIGAINKSQFQWVASNLERANPALLPVLRDNVAQRVLRRFGRVNVGIFALTIDASHQGTDQPYAPIDGNYVDLARREIQQLERDGADIIFGLTHLDMTDDVKIAQLRRDHPRFRWIAGGHEHAYDREPSSSTNALVTKGDSNARTVWKVSVVLRDQAAEVVEQKIVVDESIQPDASFQQNIEHVYQRKLRDVRSYLDDVVIKRPERCYDATEETVRNSHSDWGSFLAENMRQVYRNVSVDVAVVNGGSIRIDDRFCDQITFEHLDRTFAFPAPIVLVKLSGKDLREQILEPSARRTGGHGGFLQVSGVSFTRERNHEGKILMSDLKLQSKKGATVFDDKKTYVVAVTQFLFNCGDAYAFRNYVKEYIPPGPDLRALTYAALKTKAPKPATQPLIRNLPPYAKPISLGSATWQEFVQPAEPCRVL